MIDDSDNDGSASLVLRCPLVWFVFDRKFQRSFTLRGTGNWRTIDPSQIPECTTWKKRYFQEFFHTTANLHAISNFLCVFSSLTNTLHSHQHRRRRPRRTVFHNELSLSLSMIFFLIHQHEETR